MTTIHKTSLINEMKPTPKQKMALDMIQKYDYFLYGGA